MILNLKNADSLFKKYDLDNDGFLCESELRNFVMDTYRILGKEVFVSGEEIREYVGLMDFDGDGRVSEFDHGVYVLKSLQKRDINL